MILHFYKSSQKMTDDYFSNIISFTEYILLTKENYEETINQTENKSKIIVIECDKNKTTCIFCFEKNIFECKLSETEIIQ